jgi:hypothetical protein
VLLIVAVVAIPAKWSIEGVHQKVWGNHAATLISSDSFTDFIILNFGYLFLNSPSQSLFNTLVWLSF